MSFTTIKKKELTVQDTFYNLCKDLIKYIDRKIVKKYISPNQAQMPKDKRIQEKKYLDNKWHYFYEDEETTEEDRIKDICKNNKFLMNLQKLNEALCVIVGDMEENKKENEIKNEKIKKEDEKLKLFGEINNQLVKYLIENNMNINNINQNDLMKVLENLKNNNIIKNINQEMIQIFMNDINNNILQNNLNMTNQNLNSINNNINNNTNNNINLEDPIKDKNLNLKNNSNSNNKNNSIYKNKSIPTLIQALENINNKLKNNNSNYKKNNNKMILKNKILDSDSSDSDDDEDLDFEEEQNKEEENKINDKQKNKNDEIYKNNNNNYLNKKTKRKKIYYNKKNT